MFLTILELKSIERKSICHIIGLSVYLQKENQNDGNGTS